MQGAIPFVRFMELALYCPVYGYYEKEGDTIGRQGDFFTNVSVGALFGELLAWRFAEWLGESSKSSRRAKVQIVEAGAHGGRLALDILAWIRQRRPGLLDRLEYWIVEPSARREQWQRKALAEFSNKVIWVDGLRALQSAHDRSGGVHGLIFCNELLDAMPVRRLVWDASQRGWLEWGVALDRDRFVWKRMPMREAVRQEFGFEQAAGLAEVLPDGFTIEISPAAAEWWGQAAGCLAEGKLVAFDYGLTEEELFMPERKDGTLRGYCGHRVSSDVLANPGEQDITAHVDFGIIQRTGESSGLSTDGLFYQSQLLTSLVENVIDEWTPERRRQFQTLTHPEHLGRGFRVLIQSRKPKLSS